MDEDEISFVEAPGDNPETSYENQLEALQTYLNALPYECETPEQMHQSLENIVSKIYISVKARNWSLLGTWDTMLKSWLIMQYPMPKSTRAKLALLYYELAVLPGIEVRSSRHWVDMVSRILGTKSVATRKLAAIDLQLPWKPLWRVLKKELWPKSLIADPQRNLVNILLYLADHSKHYYPAEAVPEMLDTFIPIFTQTNALTMVPVLTSFLPLTQTNLYLPALFRIWEAFNSSVVDDRFLDMCGDLAEEHVAGKVGEAGEESAEWHDVGIWTQWQWDFLAGKALNSTTVPIGMMKNFIGNTSQHADQSEPQKSKIKKPIARMNAIAKLFVYSMRVDGEIRQDTPVTNNSRSGALPKQTGFAAGSKALDTLEKFLNSIESFFHPSNLGNWSPGLTLLLRRLSVEFMERYESQSSPTSTVPDAHKLTPHIRRHFVKLLRTPTLIAIFSKDQNSATQAQVALKILAILEPNLIMPEILERAYGGLEVVNETHRTTAVLSALSAISLPLVSENMWLGGQKHLLPLLELCLPGIDLNDPSKTVCAATFIASVVQRVKLGDLSANRGGTTFDDGMETDQQVDYIIDAIKYGDTVPVDREEERSLVRDSTASFADWVVMLFKRVFTLYENLPEEGGKKNTTGGKSEEAVLRTIRDMLEMVCQALSDPLFDLVLKLVYDYGTTNAKSNSVRAFGQLIGCLSKANSEKTVTKFLPFCIVQIEEELNHGASSVRTTSTHAAVPSDTTLHWNLSILRGCLGYGGDTMLKYQGQIIRLLVLLVEKTKGERGYTSTGRLISRILVALNSMYPLHGRYVNDEEWHDPKFNNNHNLYWGKMYEAKDVIADWHVPTVQDVDFSLEILDQVLKPALDVIESLLIDATRWDSIARNDFCRYLHACRAVWLGTANLIKLPPVQVANTCFSSFEVPEMIRSHLDMNCGFALSNPQDLRYQKVVEYRERFAQLILRAASLLRQNTGGEDHIDALVTVTRAIDTYLLTYGATRSDYDAHQKSYRQARETFKIWPGQKENYRIIFLKRAHLYHSGRAYMHSLFRDRSEIDDKLIMELVEHSLSPYTRIRRQAQSSLHTVTTHYLRSTRLILPTIFQAVTKGNDPDRMKGALYILWNKGLAEYALTDHPSHETYLVSLLECQHEEKPSVQKVVSNIANDCLGYVNEESVYTDAYFTDPSRVIQAAEDLVPEFTDAFVNQGLLDEVVRKTRIRHTNREAVWRNTVTAVLNIALRPTTHWRYVQIAAKCLTNLIRRDASMPGPVAAFFTQQAINPQPTIRTQAQKALCRLLYYVKIRTYSKSKEELWFEEWRNPLKKSITIGNPTQFLESLQLPVSETGYFVDKIGTGFLAWSKTIDGYQLADDVPPLIWDTNMTDTLQAIRTFLLREDFMTQLANLWAQESSKDSANLSIRPENWVFIKYIAKVFGTEYLPLMLQPTNAFLMAPDKFKQRAAAEIITGVLRGSKHWNKDNSETLWTWIGKRLDLIYTHMKPETVLSWQHVFHAQLENRDPRRNQVLVDWILKLQLEFSGESAFQMSKSVGLLTTFVDALGVFFNRYAPKYIDLFFANVDTDYAEIRQHLCQNLYLIMRNLWQPGYPSAEVFLTACSESSDPLQVRQAIYQTHISQIIEKMSQWKEERLPPPRVNQSRYDKVGISVLQWIWISSYGPPAHLIIPYFASLLPEISRMLELKDNPELQAYSSGALYILSALTPLSDYVDATLDKFVETIESSTSWRTHLHCLPALVIFYYRNLLSLSPEHVSKVMRVLLDCLSNENIEVREMASKVLSGVIRTSQRQSILPLKNRFVKLAKETTLPSRQAPGYATALRTLHSAVLGLSALVESFPYSVEPWLPSLTEVLAAHATDPPPISTSIRKCASEFKKTHQDTWHKDQLAFDEDQLHNLSAMLVGTSYYA